MTRDCVSLPQRLHRRWQVQGTVCVDSNIKGTFESAKRKRDFWNHVLVSAQTKTGRCNRANRPPGRFPLRTQTGFTKPATRVYNHVTILTTNMDKRQPAQHLATLAAQWLSNHNRTMAEPWKHFSMIPPVDKYTINFFFILFKFLFCILIRLRKTQVKYHIMLSYLSRMKYVALLYWKVGSSDILICYLPFNFFILGGHTREKIFIMYPAYWNV